MKTTASQILAVALLAGVLLALTPQAHAQGGVPLWTNRYDGSGNGYDAANVLAVDTNGNVLLTGYSLGNGSGYDYATLKYSGAGVPLWTNRYDGPANGDDFAFAMAMDASGNVFVTGQSAGIGSGNDFATIKYSNMGVALWTNRYNGPGNDDDPAYAVAVDGSGNVVVTGASIGSGSSYDYATIKYSGVGVALWTNRYNGPGNGADFARAVAVDGSGNVLVTGYSSGGFTTDFDYATIKYSSTGVGMWTNRYSGPLNGVNHTDFGYAVAADGSGNVFVTGHSFGNGTGPDFATIKYSSAGAALWTNR